MDPCIESQRWESFHFELIGEIARWLVPRVRPRYEVTPEQRVYVERGQGRVGRSIRVDAAVVESGTAEPTRRDSPGDTTTAIAPATYTLPMPEEQREAFLTIRDRTDSVIITVIEVLSPTSKVPGSDGRRLYLSKRVDVLESATNLVELDLLRGGARLPTVEPLEPADYYTFVCRAKHRPHADVYAWTLRRALPAIPVPLAGDDADVQIDLQAVFTKVYDDFGYDYSLDYQSPIEPRIGEADADWVAAILSEVG
jgi:hypothetical protein